MFGRARQPDGLRGGVLDCALSGRGGAGGARTRWRGRRGASVTAEADPGHWLGSHPSSDVGRQRRALRGAGPDTGLV
jgi:hypothetical protein